jgi:drug/metabolite transporter superfamily protein YnfA
MNANQKDVGWGFWLWWVLASVMGYGVGAILGFVIPIFANINHPAAFGILFGVVFGAVGGLAQWLVLRRQIPEVGLWAPASALGFVIAAGIVAIVASMDQQVASNSNIFFLFAAVYGVTGGFLQWLILRRQGVAVGWWLAANLLGSLLGIALGNPASAAFQTGERYPGGIFLMILFGFGAALGVGLGVTTGGALVWLLRHPKSGPKAEAARQGTP